MTDAKTLVARLRCFSDVTDYPTSINKAADLIEQQAAEIARQRDVIGSVNARCDHLGMRLGEVIRERDALRAELEREAADHAQANDDAAHHDIPKWLPIETAPEGEHILLWFQSGERGIGGIECATIYGDADSATGFSFWTHGGPNSGSDWEAYERPTHWMPLPAPPATQET